MLRGEVQILLQLARGQAKHGSHKDKLQNFYSPQAAHYDRFREKLLPGRARMLEVLAICPGHRIVELGAGTARNLELLPTTVRASAEHFYVVDLCPALIEQARDRCDPWHNVSVIEADATEFDPGLKVDRVFFSYALTMIPDWQAALRNAYRILNPGGLIGVVDFQVRPDTVRKPNVARYIDKFWQKWFSHDGVRLNPAHLAYLGGMFETQHREELTTPVPYMPLLRVPYYIFLGRK